MMPDAIRWYDQNVSDVSRRYESAMQIIFILHGIFSGVQIVLMFIRLLARPERFELPTPRFVVCTRWSRRRLLSCLVAPQGEPREQKGCPFLSRPDYSSIGAEAKALRPVAAYDTE
jgi:hypothetical protein